MAGMLRVNMTLQELELGECDLVTSRGSEPPGTVSGSSSDPASVLAGNAEHDWPQHRSEEQHHPPVCGREPGAALQPPGRNFTSSRQQVLFPVLI